MLVLSKSYVNQNVIKKFKVENSYSLQIFTNIAVFNMYQWNLTAIVKEFLLPVVEYLDVSEIESVNELKLL